MFDVPLLFVGTDFQKTVWNELLNIPFGTTVSYGEMARRIGMPKAVRAVANANGANAMSIFVPCHRVIGSNRSLTGYGGGLEAKQQNARIGGLLFFQMSPTIFVGYRSLSEFSSHTPHTLHRQPRFGFADVLFRQKTVGFPHSRTAIRRLIFVVRAFRRIPA